MLYPRQALYGTTAGASSAISSISASTQNQGSSASDDKDSRSALWKYAIVVILAILALSTLFRLMFLRRARRMRQMQQEALGLRVAGRRGGGTTPWGGLQQQSEDRRRFSTDTVDLQERGYSGAPLESTEPPPPAYDDDRPTLAPLSSSIQPPPPVVQHRPSFLSRFSSRFKRTPSETPTPRTNLASAIGGGGGATNQPPRVDPNEDYFGISMRQASSTEATAQVLAEENQTNQRRGVTAIQRALSDAGLLVGRSRGLSRSESNGPRDIVNAAEAAQREREERRRVRRERRRERRRRERERDEGLGLPVYSKKKAEGEEVLQVAEGIKEDETDSEDDGSASEGENGEPSITPPSRPSTSQNVDPVTNTAEDPSAPPMVVTRPHPLA